MNYYFDSNEKFAWYDNLNHTAMKFIKSESKKVNWKKKGGWISFVKEKYNGNLHFYGGKPHYIEFEDEADFIMFMLKI